MNIMRTVIDTPQSPAHDSLIDKKSEFIANACHVSDLDEAMLFVQSVRMQHPKARHVAYAAICGDKNGCLSERMSDDGEPSGTAGKPILDVIRSSNLTDTVVTVTRYFGGILLGSGGLIRAYSRSAASAISCANIRDIVECKRVMCNISYQQLRMFKNILSKYDGVVEREEYGEFIRINMLIPTKNIEEFAISVRNAFSDAILLEQIGDANSIS